MSEFSDHEESPTAFLFENLHDVEELLIFDEIDVSPKVDEIKVGKNNFVEKKISFEQNDSNISPEIIEIEDEVDENDRTISQAKSGTENLSEKVSPNLFDSRQKSTEKSESQSSKKSKIFDEKSSSSSKKLEHISKDISPKVRTKKNVEISKQKSK